MLLCHRAIVAGWELRAELVLNKLGALQLRVNGENVGGMLTNCTMAQGRRQYQAMLKRLAKPRQMLLPI